MFMTQHAPHHRHRKWLKKVIFISLILIAVLFLSSPLMAKQVTVQTNQQQIQMGDIITLIVETDFSAQGEPDLQQMKDQFDILGTQRSSQIQITNGHYQSFSRWIVQISPKQIGELVIPPFEIDGILSQPLMIQVAQAQHLGSQHRGSSFLESTLNTQQVYLQQQVLFTLKFYHQGRFIDGNIRPPVFENALSETLQSQFNYQTKIDGNTYEVYQWTWAFYPQRSGAMVIPAQGFYGRIQHQGQLKQVKDQTQPLSLQVNPKPNNYPAQSSWLPAQSLSLSEDWQMQQPIRVGDAIKRTLKIDAKGLLHSQLPELSFANKPGFHLYPNPVQAENQITPDGINSQKTIEVAIVPTQAGKITLPEIKIDWWNTTTNQLQTTTLAAKTLDILPAINTQPNQPTSQQTPNPSTQQNPVVSHETLIEKPLQNSETTGWQIAVASLMGVWFLTVIGFGYWIVKLQGQLKQQAYPEKDLKNDQAWSNLSADMRQLCEQQTLEAKPLFSALLHWQHQHPNVTSDHLEQLLTELKAHLYGQAPLAEKVLSKICEEVTQLSNTQVSSPTEANRLVSIYPTQHQD